MSIDLSKLTPAPWECIADQNGYFNLCYGPRVIAQFVHRDECESASFARNALDVMMRRGWHAEYRNVSYAEKPLRMAWVAAYHDNEDGHVLITAGDFPDPFTALVEADKWLTARESNAASAPPPADNPPEAQS